MTKSEGTFSQIQGSYKNKQLQRQKQIPFGDDKQEKQQQRQSRWVECIHPTLRAIKLREGWGTRQ